MKIFTQITRILFTLLISVFIGSAALAQCVTPVFTSIGNSGPVCTGGTITLNAAGTVGGVSSGFIRMAGIGANAGHREFDKVFSSGDRAGSIDRISMTQFDAIFAGQPTDAARAAALKARYDVLMFTWASPIDYNITVGLITAYLSTGGSVFVDGDYANILRLNDGSPNSIVGVGSGTTGGCSYTLVSPAPFPTLVANGVNGCFANDHLYVTSWPTWMKPYITSVPTPWMPTSRTLAIAGIYPGGSGGRLIVQGPDQDFHASRAGAPGSIEQNQYQIILNQIDFLKANQSGITWTGPNGFTSNDANATITNVTAANAGVYTATLTNTTGGGCSVTATTTVVVTSSTPTITASGPTNICPGGSVTLTASAGASYNWSNGATTQSIVVSTPGNYTVTVNTPGCSGTSAPTAVIVQDNVPPVVITKNITVYLSGGNATITPAQINNGSTDNCAIATYALDKTTFDCSNDGANTVTLTVTDNSGNISTETAVVTVIGMIPTPSIAVSRTDNTNTNLDANTIALGYGAQQLTLTASNPNSAPGASTYLWSPAAGLSNANIANPVFTPTQAGSYTFNVLVTSEYGCQASTSVTIKVIDVRCGNKGDKVLVCHKTGSAKNPYVQICISPNAVATHLAEGDILGTCATITLNEKVLAVTGSDLSNVSKGSNGTKEVVTIMDQPQLSASNILSPNGDGQNDTWVISNLDKYSQNKVTIVDRNGKVVYTKVNYRNDWDGTFNTGILPEDTYYYTVDFGKGVNQLKGFINIMR